MGEEKYEEKLQKLYQTPEIFYIWVKFQWIKGEIGQLEKQLRIFSNTQLCEYSGNKNKE